MDFDADRVIQKLSIQIAAQMRQMAILQAKLEVLQEENERLKKQNEGKAE